MTARAREFWMFCSLFITLFGSLTYKVADVLLTESETKTLY